MAIDDILARYDAPAAGGGVDDILKRHEEPAPTPAAMPDKGALSAAGRGALQGVSFGFFDEAAAALRALADSGQQTRGAPGFVDRYRANIGEERAQLHADAEQHPIASTLGQVAGGAVAPGLGLAKLGGGLAANIARGAGQGIAAGAGQSEAKDVGGIVSDAAKGGLAGGVLGGTVGFGMEKVMRGATRRVDERTIQNITGGRATNAGKKVYAEDELVVAAAKKFGLDTKDAADPRALAEATKAARDEVGGKLDVAYKAIDHEALGVRTSDIRRAVGRVKAELTDPLDKPLRRELDTYVEQMAERWGSGARDRIPLQALNKSVGRLEKVGFASADISPGASAELNRNLAGALDDVLQKRLEEVKELGGRIAKSSLARREGWAGMASAAEAAKVLPDLNRDYRGLKLIQDIADQRAVQAPQNRAAGGLRNIAGNSVKGGAVVASLMSGNPLPAVAAFAGPPLARAAGKHADQALARLYQAAQSGSVTAQIVQEALEAGVSRGLVSRLAGGLTTEQQP